MNTKTRRENYNFIWASVCLVVVSAFATFNFIHYSNSQNQSRAVKNLPLSEDNRSVRQEVLGASSSIEDKRYFLEKDDYLKLSKSKIARLSEELVAADAYQSELREIAKSGKPGDSSFGNNVKTDLLAKTVAEKQKLLQKIDVLTGIQSKLDKGEELDVSEKLILISPSV